MTTNPTFESHAAELAEAVGLEVEVHQEGNRLFAVVKGYLLPDGVAEVARTDVLLVGDTQYPLSAMDMFWTELDVVRPDGSTFQGSDSIEQHLGRQWRRFSYHRNGTWSPTGNPLLHHFTFMETRWTGKATR